MTRSESALAVLDERLRTYDEARKAIAAGDAVRATSIVARLPDWHWPAEVLACVREMRASTTEPAPDRDWHPDGFGGARGVLSMSWEEQVRGVLSGVLEERRRQHKKWGQQDHPSFPKAKVGTWTVWRSVGEDMEATARLELEDEPSWVAILAEEVGEALQERDDAKLRAELVQVAAVAVAWVEAIDRRRQVTRG